jgi:predicted N-formylglutamate amidohydrolase
MPPASLLDADEPDPVMLRRPHGGSVVLIACDHAGNRLPRRLGTLGVSAAERARHIGWDIGAWGVCTLLADALDACAIGQAYSRLAMDCNRHPSWPGAAPEISEATPIPGNVGLTEADREARRVAIHQPYHAALGGMLAERRAAGRPTMLLAMHSFTPIYRGVARPWHAGVLFNRDNRMAMAMAELLRAEGEWTVGENEPYAVSDASDYTVPVHAEPHHLPYLELEVRQDLIADAAGQARWAALLARLLPIACRRLPGLESA